MPHSLVFDYTVEYSDRKHLTIEVNRDAELVIKAPINTDESIISSAIEKKKLWIYEKINHPAKYKRHFEPKRLINGETFEYLGRNYKLKIIDDDSSVGLAFNNGFLLTAKERVNGQKLFKDWYQLKAKEKLIPKIRNYASHLGVNYQRILISDLKYRWGSCTVNNNLNFNYRLIRAPHHVIDYIIVHELTHLIEPNHSPRFWNLVGITFPKYKEAREWLRLNGQKLEVEV